MKPTLRELKELRSIASLQFKGVGEEFIPSEVMIAKSRKTQKIRAIYLNNVPLAFLRAEDYRFTLTIYGGLRLNDLLPIPHLR
ncbi:MAG: pseudouridine synthase, partial [Desulfurococcaceae archaeon]